MRNKLNLIRKTSSTFLTLGTIIAFSMMGCSKGFKMSNSREIASTLPSPVVPEAIVAGNGGLYSGVGALSGPTADGVVVRIQNGLEKNVNPMAGNFATVLAQVRGNLPKTPDPTRATGFDQVQLLIYAACSDLTTGTTPLMQSKYSVPTTGTVAANKAALIAAGKKMLDQYTAGLATQGNAAGQIDSALGVLVDRIAKESTNTSKMAFMGVCIAANTAGSSMTGF
jgi:hypothetical protein